MNSGAFGDVQTPKPAERCRCGTCKRFIGHVANDDHSCSRCCNKPVWKEGDDWQPIICSPCKDVMKNEFDSRGSF